MLQDLTVMPRLMCLSIAFLSTKAKKIEKRENLFRVLQFASSLWCLIQQLHMHCISIVWCICKRQRKKKILKKKNLIPVRWMCNCIRIEKIWKHVDWAIEGYLSSPYFFFFKRKNGADWKVFEFAADKHFLICCAGALYKVNQNIFVDLNTFIKNFYFLPLFVLQKYLRLCSVIGCGLYRSSHYTGTQHNTPSHQKYSTFVSHLLSPL